jgi:hypothetical protein
MKRFALTLAACLAITALGGIDARSEPAKDDFYIAVKRVTCGPFEGIFWAKTDGSGAGYYRMYGTIKPKDQKRFKDKDDGLYFDGKKCAED